MSEAPPVRIPSENVYLDRPETPLLIDHHVGENGDPDHFSWKCLNGGAGRFTHEEAMPLYQLLDSHLGDQQVEEATTYPTDHSQDPRLASLPTDLRAVAEEFLELHGAWDTEFAASADEGFLEIGWEAVWPGTHLLKWAARFKFEGRPQPSYCERWGLEFREKSEVDGKFTWGRVGSALPALRRSADFAEFVQRFKAVQG